MKIETLIHEHPCFFEDLQIASALLEKSRPIVSAALAEYADALEEYEEKTVHSEPVTRRTFDWEVSEEGDLYCDDASYYIGAELLGTENWIGHMARKKWVNFNTFIPAYIEACRRAGVQTVKIAY